MPPDPFSGDPDDETAGDETAGDDALSGMPLFGDLARLLSRQDPIGWDAARQLALSIATDGGQEGNVDPLARIHLEQLVRIAELHVGAATGLPTSFGGTGVTVMPVTRGQWAATTLDAWRPLFERLAGSLTPAAPPTPPDPSDPLGFMAPLMAMMGPMMLGMTAGPMIGHLSRRSFGCSRPGGSPRIHGPAHGDDGPDDARHDRGFDDRSPVASFVRPVRPSRPEDTER